MITVGVDIGSTTCKAVVLRDDVVLARLVLPNGALPSESARQTLDLCLSEAGVALSQVDAVATTGYGRRLAGFGDLVVTEIKACALGCCDAFCARGQVRTIVDVGGQDTKIIALDSDGGVSDFAMNDKCAAGTGRFLEMLSAKLGLPYEEFVGMAAVAEASIQMNSTCAVFAESEVVSLLARGVSAGAVAAAAHDSIARRIGSMARRVGAAEVVCFVGGGGRNRALVRFVEEEMGMEIHVPEFPQAVTAFGAARAAVRKLSGRKDGL